MENFCNTVVLAVGWNNLMALMVAAGFPGRATLGSLLITNLTGNASPLKIMQTVSAVVPPGGTSGVTVAAGASNQMIYGGSGDTFIDAGVTWIYSATAQNIDIIASNPA